MRYRRLLVLALGLCAAARAEAQSARVERRGPAQVDAEAGATLTVPFRVTRLAAGPGVIPGSAALPPGWSATGGGARELAPGQAELRLLGVRVPAAAAAGRYVVRYQAGGGADSAVVVVAARRAVVVQAEGAGGMVVAGEAYAVRFRVMNQGNVAERLVLHAVGDRGIQPRADSSDLLLPPASERTVTVRAETDRRMTASVRHQVTLHAAGDADSAAAHVVVTIVPAGAGRATRRGLPAELRVRASDSLAAAGFAFHAGGALDRAGRVLLDLEARTADPAGAPFRRQDEYRLRLEAPGLALRLGDDVYALSRLTGPGLYATGAAASLRRGLLGAGALAARDRRGQGHGGVAGGFARIGSERARLGVVLAVPDSARARWTVEAAAAPFALLRLEAEAGPPADGGATTPRALRAWGSGRVLSYEVLHLRGASAYGGTGSRDQDFASLTLRPFGELSLSASARRGGDFRLLGDTVLAFLTSRRASLAWRSLLTLEVRETAGASGGRGDLRAARVRVGIPLFRRGWLHPAYEAGEMVSTSGAAPAPFRILSLQTTLSARGGAALGMYAQLYEGASVRAAQGREWSGSLSAHLPVTRGTWVRVFAQARRADGRPHERLLDLSVERALGGGHRLMLRGLADGGAQTRPRGFVEYALPLALPLPAAGDGRVTARVFDPSTGKGIAGVLVRVADRMAVTDARGIAGFSGLPAGEHTLRIEPGTGPERVADRDLPVPVPAGPGARRIDIGLQAAGGISGGVERTPAGAPADSVQAMPGVEVELIGPGGTRRTTTDAAGRFHVSGLRPGWWRVRVAPGSLPRHHEAREHQMLLVPAGGEGRAWLRVVEKDRPVQVIQSGELTLP